MDSTEEHIRFALGCLNSKGSVEKSVELLKVFQQSLNGQIVPFNPDVYLRGAVNRGGVTCYLDSLLFAMFAKLPYFEGMLRKSFEDEPISRLSAILRVYVNMLRRGILVEVDIVGSFIVTVTASANVHKRRNNCSKL